jgi:ketosteroid isomerase-like protein
MERFDSNLDLVRRVYALVQAYLTGSREEAVRRLPYLVARDATLVPSSALPSGSIGPYRGAEGVLEWLAAVREQWSRFEVEAEELVDVPPERVVVVARTSASRADGRGYAGRIGQVWELRNGRVGAVTSFHNPANALERAGLEPGRLTGRSSAHDA